MPRQPQSLGGFNTDHLQADLKGRSVRGGLLNLTSQGVQFLIQFISTVVLARLLTPADFGLVAMVATVTGLGQAFADLGLSEATIQRKDINHDQVSILFWINVAIGLGLTLATVALAPALAWFYRDPRLINITLVLSLTFLIGGLRVQPDALLKRQMRFSSLAVRDVVSYGLAVTVAITLARGGAGYWALVALPMTLNFTQMVLTVLMVNWRPGLPRRDANVRSMIAFGSNVAASYFIVTVNRNADNVLIGWYWGASPLGLYSRAYNLLMLPVRQLTASASSVAIPAFSRTQDDPEHLARYYLRAANLIMWIGAPLFAFLFVVAKPLIGIVLGNQWQEAAPVFQILAISALGQLLLELSIWLFVGRGQSKQLLKLLLIISPIIIAGFVIGLPFGIKGVALSGSVVLVSMIPWMLKFAFRGTTLTLQRAGRALVYPLSLGLAAVLSSEIALRMLGSERIFSQFLVAFLDFAVLYSLSAFITPVRQEMMALWKLSAELRLSRTGRSPVPIEVEN